MDRTLPDGVVHNRKTFITYHVPAIALAVAGPMASSIYAMAIWALTADLNLTNAFPWSTGPLSIWMIWFGLGIVANLGVFLRPSKIQAEKSRVTVPLGT